MNVIFHQYEIRLLQTVFHKKKKKNSVITVVLSFILFRSVRLFDSEELLHLEFFSNLIKELLKLTLLELTELKDLYVMRSKKNIYLCIYQ